MKAGVIDKSGTNNPSASQATQHPSVTLPSKTPLLTPVSTGSGTATYRVAIAALRSHRDHLDRPLLGEYRRRRPAPQLREHLGPNNSQREVLLGPSTVDVGAGGTKVIVTSGRRTFTLTPASAPFSYQFVLKS